MDFEPSAKAKDYVARVRAFMQAHVFPAEKDYWAAVDKAADGGDWRTWSPRTMTTSLHMNIKIATRQTRHHISTGFRVSCG